MGDDDLLGRRVVHDGVHAGIGSAHPILIINTADLDVDEVVAQITKRVRAEVGQYVMYQATEPNKHGNFPGIFGLTNRLAQDGLLSPTDYT